MNCAHEAFAVLKEELKDKTFDELKMLAKFKSPFLKIDRSNGNLFKICLFNNGIVIVELAGLRGRPRDLQDDLRLPALAWHKSRH